MQIVELRQTILQDNDKDAEALRQENRQAGFCYLNVMSSPGSGKTTTILALLGAIGNRLSCAVMEADIDSDVDAQKIRAAGYPSVQLHTGGMCHLDAQMSRQGIRALLEEVREEAAQQETAAARSSGSDSPVIPDLIILENVGNLVCPAEFDTGADLNLAILSVPEGDDKPLKYPLMFRKCDVVLINKIDSLPAFDFDLDKCRAAVRRRNPEAVIFPVSARTGEGIPAVADWIVEQVKRRQDGG